MHRYHTVQNIHIRQGVLHLEVDGLALDKPLAELSPRLAQAAPEEQERFEISPSGYGIHWPLLDEDLSIDGLLGIAHRPAEWKKTA